MDWFRSHASLVKGLGSRGAYKLPKISIFSSLSCSESVSVPTNMALGAVRKGTLENLYTGTISTLTHPRASISTGQAQHGWVQRPPARCFVNHLYECLQWVLSRSWPTYGASFKSRDSSSSRALPSCPRAFGREDVDILRNLPVTFPHYKRVE